MVAVLITGEQVLGFAVAQAGNVFQVETLIQQVGHRIGAGVPHHGQLDIRVVRAAHTGDENLAIDVEAVDDYDRGKGGGFGTGAFRIPVTQVGRESTA